MKLALSVALSGSLLLVLAPRADAQGLRFDLRAASRWSLPAAPAGDSASATVPAAGPLAAAPVAQNQQLPCPDCEPRDKHFLRASGELVTVLVVPWAFNYYVRDKDFAHVGLKSMWANITGDWVWDDNTFQTNQIAHPLHGAFYFNAFRSSGYNFWASSIAAGAGAYLWECCGETHPPAPNDLINTSLGGIALGEMMWRVSTLALDNTATGSERTWREIGGFLASPWHGFNRFVTGRSNDIAANPADWRPAFTQASLDLGVRAIGSRGSSFDVLDSTLSDLMVRFRFVYGRPVEDLVGKPFSTFAIDGELAIGSDRQALQVLTVYGGLGGKHLRADTNVRHTLAAKMNYEYYFFPDDQLDSLSSVVFEYGAQSFTGGIHSAFALSPRWRLLTEAALRGVALAGVRSDYYVVSGEGRNYDFGPGLGFKLQAHLVNGRRFIGSLGYQGTYIHTVSGTDYDHFLDHGFVEARYFVSQRVGLGASFNYWHRDSRPTDAATAPGPATDMQLPQARLFVTTAIPRLGDAIWSR